jgi:hypothetical protein
VDTNKVGGINTDKIGAINTLKKCGFCNRVTTHKISIGKISEFYNFEIPGRNVIGDVKNPIYMPNKGETLCGLSGHFMIYQYTKGKA